MSIVSILTYALTLIVVLGILVVVHEWGHFIVARMCGIRVDEFSLGFGPRALRIGKRGDTEYNIRWIPLGGFVKIAGMEADEAPLLNAKDKVQNLAASSDTKPEDSINLTTLPLVAENTPDLSETDEQKQRDAIDGYYAHPIWQRALVIFAGPFMSFMLGYVVIFGLMLALGIPDKALNQVDSVNAGSEAERIGLKDGDTILSINGHTVSDGDEMVKFIHSNANKPITLIIQVKGRNETIVGTPRPTKLPDGTTGGILGFTPKYHMLPTTPHDALVMTNRFTVAWFQQFGSLFAHHNLKTIGDHMGGPIFIAQATKSAVDSGGESVPLLLAQLSLSLAIFNLLPIPILDGGHLMIFAIEGIRRGRRLTMEQQQNFMLAGLAIIGVLFVLIMFNDISRHIHP